MGVCMIEIIGKKRALKAINYLEKISKGDIVYAEKQHGICILLGQILNHSEMSKIFNIWEKWEHFSGHRNYPVPATPDFIEIYPIVKKKYFIITQDRPKEQWAAKLQFHETGKKDHFDNSEYGKKRKQLAAFLAKELRKRMFWNLLVLK